jgi:hypothetical protein
MPDLNSNTAIIGFVGAVIGGLLSFLGSYLAYKGHIKGEQRNIATALDIDLKNIHDSSNFNFYYNAYKNDFIETFNIKPSQKIVSPQKLYDEINGLYFVFIRDITKFDHALSEEIYTFYNDLFRADFYRVFTKQYENEEYENVEKVVKAQYNLMRALIINCGNNILKIQKQLQKVYDSKSLSEQILQIIWKK